MLFNICVTAPKRPIINFTIDGQEYQYDGNDLTIEGKLKMVNDGEKGWKMWCYTSLSFSFSFINNSLVDICAVGHGGSGSEWYDGYRFDQGGNGGRGGEVVNLFNQTFLIGDTITTEIGDNTIVRKNGGIILQPQNGTGASGGGGQYVWHSSDGHDDPNGPYQGGNGKYAFGDTDGNITFDGVRYAPGGGGGGTYRTGTYGEWAPWGVTNTWGVTNIPGYDPAPGYGGHGNGNKAGGIGIVLLRYKG